LLLRKNLKKEKAKIIKLKTKWIFPYKDHPSDKLKIRFMLDEKIKGAKIIALEARIEPGKIHQLHIHNDEYVIVYSIKGRCSVTIGNKTKTVLPYSLIYIPPKVPHRFENNSSKLWQGVAFAIGNKSKIKNIWLDK